MWGGPIACWILAPTSSSVTWSLYEMRGILYLTLPQNKGYIAANTAQLKKRNEKAGTAVTLHSSVVKGSKSR